MSKTSIVLAAIALAGIAHAAAAFGTQDCTPDPNHAWALGGKVSVHDSTGNVYAVTSIAASLDSTNTMHPTNGADVDPALVTDSNVLGDCNGDGAPGDYDGDLDVGVGGFFFGSGTTWEALCHYGHNVHSTSGTTADALGLPYLVLIGVDDPNGPSPPVYDPVAGQEIQGCQTDGVLDPPDTHGTPGPDGDCLVGYPGNGAYGPVCGGGVGGDDGYWGFPEELVDDDPAVSSPLVGTANAAF